MNEKIQQIYNAVLTADYSNIKQMTADALNAGVSADAIIKEGVLDGLFALHEKLYKGTKVFPDTTLFMAYEAVRICLEDTLPLREKKAPIATVVFGTPADDTHDVGGKWCALTLMAAGYNVEYLGRDVPCEEFVNKAVEVGAEVIAVSCHQTTAYNRINEIKALIAESPIADKVLFLAGGSVITDLVAEKLGVAYAPHATDVVTLLNERFGVK